MATLDDLFGGSAPRRPSSPKWPNVGDKHDGVISGEVVKEQQLDVTNTWNPMFLEKQPDGSWKAKHSGELTAGSERMELDQIVIPVTLLNREEATFYVDNKAKKAALKDAMQASGLSLTPGTGIRMERTANSGRAFNWSFKLAAPKE